MDRARNPRLTLLVVTLLVGVTFAVFWPVIQNTFIGYDDFEYIVQNPHVATGLKWENVKWALTASYSSNWHPVTWISHMLDVQMFGAKTGWHHFISLLVHVANSALLFSLLRRLTGALWRSAVVAALFALHPLHVESVAWAAERKDVLSTLFFMLTLLCYTRYVELKNQPADRNVPDTQVPTHISARPLTFHASRITHHASLFYALSLLAFTLGLMSKPMLVTVPFVLLLLDYWPLHRLSFREESFNTRNVVRLIAEKAPFFALAAGSCVLTVVAQRKGGAVAPLDMLPFGARVENAFVAYFTYLQKMVWPTDLAVIYLRPGEWPIWQEVLGVIVTLGLTLTALVFVRTGQQPYLSVGWLWYMGTLVPVIGVVQVGMQAFADRYTYLPLIGCFIAIVWGVCELAQRWRFGLRLAAGLALSVLVLMGVVSNRQVRLWKNTETLLTHCIRVTTDNYMAHNILGVALSGQNRFAEAKSHFLEALRIQPTYGDALQNLGILLVWHGDFNEANDYLHQAITVKPSATGVYSRLGFALDLGGRTKDAVACYWEAVRLRADDVKACNDLAWILATCAEADLRDGLEAVRLAEHACELTGTNHAVFVGTLSAAYAEAGRFPEAIDAAQKAIALSEAAGQPQLAKKNRQLLEIYRSGKPYREPATQVSAK